MHIILHLTVPYHLKEKTKTFSNHLGNSCIDIRLTNDSNHFNWLNTELFNGSDHSIILMSTYYGGGLNNRIRVQNIERTDWKLFTNSLQPLPPYEVSSIRDLDLRSGQIVGYIAQAYDFTCPPKLTYPGKPCNWWNASLRSLLRKKNIAARLARRHKGTPMGLR